MFRYDYIAVVDIDEVIMPQQHNSWHEMIKEINKKTPVELNNISTFVFRHALFQDEEGEKLEVEEDIPVWLHMMNHVYRSVKYFPPRYNVKSIHRTERTQAPHFPWFPRFSVSVVCCRSFGRLLGACAHPASVRPSVCR